MFMVSKMDEIVKHEMSLYNLALKKSGSPEESEDLVQDTYIKAMMAINNGVIINKLKPYLMQIMMNLIRRSMVKKKRLKESYEKYEVEQEIEYEELDAFIKEHNETEIRKVIAFMPKLYRETLDKFYFKEMKIKDIAKEYKVTDNTIKQRLFLARELLKEGVLKMENYLENCRNPVFLSIGFSGISGLNGTLDYLLDSLIEQNLLVLVNNNPMAESEIGKALGVSTVFVEELVIKLKKYELLKERNKKYYTDFLLIDVEPFTKKMESMRGFTEEVYPVLERVTGSLYKEHLKHGLLKAFNETQLYMFTVFSINYYSRLKIIEKFKFDYIDKSKKTKDNGSWVIDFGLRNTKSKLYVPDLFLGGPRIILNKNLKLFEWNALYAKTFRADFNHDYSIVTRFLLLYDLCVGNKVSHQIMPLIYELVKYGFLSINPNSKNKYKVNIPLIKEKDFKKIENMTKGYVDELLSSFDERVIDILKNNPLSESDKNTSNYYFCHFGHLSSIAIHYLNMASEKGILDLKENENYPISLIIEK